MYSVWLLQMTHGHQNLDCFQEQPVWCTPNVELPQNPNDSITGREGGFVTLYPDLGLVKVSREKDMWLLIGELKRSPKRHYIFSNVGFERKSKGWEDLRAKVALAISQVQGQAYVAVHENPSQQKVVLFAASGPFWTYVVASCEEINALFIEDEDSAEPPVIAERLQKKKKNEKECEDDEDEDEDDEDQDGNEDQEKANNVTKDIDMLSNIDMARDDLLSWNLALDRLQKKSKRSRQEELLLLDLKEEVRIRLQSGLSWAKVMFAGTRESNKAIKTVREKINELATSN
jgi:hypothetical protein